jgi:DNA-binding winged helix-turn-helix (wHTH) protein
MPHLLVIDIDDSTLAAIEDLMQSRALIPASVRHLAPNGAATNPMPSVEPAEGPPAINTPEPVVIKDTVQSTSDLAPSPFGINRVSPPPLESRTLIFARWRLDLVRHELRTADDALVPLSDAEFELLYVFAKHPHRWLTRSQILEFMKGHVRPSRARSIDVYVSRLRRKLEVDIRSPKIVQTVRNGYKFSAAVTIR